MAQRLFVIRATGEADRDESGSPLYWNNADGYGSRANVTLFNQRERDGLNLPIGGEWLELAAEPDKPAAPVYMQTVAQALATSLDALRRCEAAETLPRMQWAERWRERIEWLCKNFLPSGSGIDCGVTLELERSKPDCLRLLAPFHHMDSHGSYSGWSDYKLTVRPSLIHGLTVDVSGRDAGGTRDYIADTVRHALAESHPHDSLYPAHWADKPAELAEVTSGGEA